MQGRAYLDLAREVMPGGSEVHWRGAAGRAYYALLLECREALFRWGFTLPARDNVHPFVRLRFNYAADADVKAIGKALDKVSRLRNQADYDLSALPAFTSAYEAQGAVQNAARALALLDTIHGDPTRQAVAIAAIRLAFP